MHTRRCRRDESNQRVTSSRGGFEHGDVGPGRKRHARFLAGLGSERADRGRVPQQGTGAQVPAAQAGDTAHDRLRGDLRRRDLRQCRHMHGHRPELVHADRHQLLSLQSGHIRPHSTYIG